MDSKTFRLLKIINRKIEFSIKGNRISNRDKRIRENELFRRLEYLLNNGFISKINGKYIITERGFFVIQFDSWQDYLHHIKDTGDRTVKKERLDLKISEFQIKTKWLPYYISAISIVFSFIALFFPSIIRKEKTEKPLKQSNIREYEKQQDKSLAIDTFQTNMESNNHIHDIDIEKIEASK